VRNVYTQFIIPNKLTTNVQAKECHCYLKWWRSGAACRRIRWSSRYISATIKGTVSFLGASLRHVCMSVCSHGATRVPIGLIFMKFDIRVFFETFEKIRISLKCNNKFNIHLLLYLAQLFLTWEMFQINVVEKIKTHDLCWNTFSNKCAIYETMWKMLSQTHHRWQYNAALARCVLYGYRITLRIYNTYCFSTATNEKWMCLIVTLCIHCPSFGVMIHK
jgi:hypothetical protein